MPIQEFIPLLSSAAGIGGDIIGNMMQQGNIARQNEYNKPINQLRRLREAGLPGAAALGGQMSGNQSSLPQTDMSGTKGSINAYATTQMAMKQAQLLNAEIRSKNAEADQTEAVTNWLLSKKGEDTAGTNLTSNLTTQQSAQQAQEQGARIANRIQDALAQNQAFTLNEQNTTMLLNNEKLREDIKSVIQNRGLTDLNIQGKEIENKIRNVIANYQPRMSEAELQNLYKRNGLIDEQITGEKLSNATKEITNYILDATKGNQITKSDMDVIMSELTWDKMQTEFATYKDYQNFVSRAKKLFQGDSDNWNLLKLADRLSALIYTTVVSPSGYSNPVGGILGGIK